MMSTIPTTIDDIKSAMFKNRKNAFECLQLFHAQLKPPKKLKSIIENKGNRVTYRCVDEDCSVRISIKSVSRAGQSYWIIYSMTEAAVIKKSGSMEFTVKVLSHYLPLSSPSFIPLDMCETLVR